MKVPGLFLAFLALVLVNGTSSAQIYKWVDESGVVHFSDTPTQSASEAGVKLDPDFFKPLDEGRPDRVSANAPTVEIYETSWCGYCKKAKKFFRSRGIKFKAYDIEKDEGAARRMMTYTRRRAVPLVVINGHTIQGYSEQAYKQALRN
jgi:glutaredoxin-like YruB-family protein